MSEPDSTTSEKAQSETTSSLAPDDLPNIYVGGAARSTEGAGDGREVVITEVENVTAPSWSLRRAIVTGAIIGALFGSVFFAGYAGTSAWICSARLDCGHWAPITIVGATGAAVSTLAGGFAGFVMHKLYRVFKVA